MISLDQDHKAALGAREVDGGVKDDPEDLVRVGLGGEALAQLDESDERGGGDPRADLDPVRIRRRRRRRARPSWNL
jgi:hypothetical protein